MPPARPARFNPLDWLAPGDVDITENAMLLADALVVPEGNGDRFWIEEAKALLQGLILYVATDERECESRHLGRVRDLLLLDGEENASAVSADVRSPCITLSPAPAHAACKRKKSCSPASWPRRRRRRISSTARASARACRCLTSASRT